MIFAIDFDGTVVQQKGAYDDTTTPLEFMPGARRTLFALKMAGHVLLLWSARASRSLLIDPTLDPLVRAGARIVNMDQWRKSQPINIARHRQMLDFVAKNLPGVFDAIDDGAAGKPSCDRFIDDRAIGLGRGAGKLPWAELAELYGVLLLAMPKVEQETNFSCGAAALLSVLRYFEVPVADERQLYADLGTNARTGTAPEEISRVANEVGLMANWRTGVEVRDLRDAIAEGVPVILDVQEPEDGVVKPRLPDGHYVVLAGIDQKTATIMNPSGGKLERLPLSVLYERWIDTDGVRGGIFIDGRA